MKKQIIIFISSLILLTQPIKADEINLDPRLKELTEKFNYIIECINKELKDIKEFQIKQWEKGKEQNIKNLKVVQHKLTGFFSDLPLNNKDKN
tara:strand:+ start:867 stop:1145 length:279 start_codon:yes stop_codon:yes gene_type:complete